MGEANQTAVTVKETDVLKAELRASREIQKVLVAQLNQLLEASSHAAEWLRCFDPNMDGGGVKCGELYIELQDAIAAAKGDPCSP